MRSIWEYLPFSRRQASHTGIVIGILLGSASFILLVAASGGLYDHELTGEIVGIVGLLAAFSFAIGFILWPYSPAEREEK